MLTWILFDYSVFLTLASKQISGQIKGGTSGGDMARCDLDYTVLIFCSW